jgi:hypothetical protein
MKDDLLKKILEVQKIMRHDFLNHIQVISGYVQLGDLERVKEYTNKTIEKIQRFNRVGNIALPCLQGFLSWFVAFLDSDRPAFELQLKGNMDKWGKNDEELTGLLMELLSPVHRDIINGRINAILTLHNDTAVILAYKGLMDTNNLKSIHPVLEMLSLEHTEPAPGELVITINQKSENKQVAFSN